MTMGKDTRFCVILAGGKGRRLWPSSREARPKQFIDFFGIGRTQLQQAFDRMRGIVPDENIFVCTQAEYAHWVWEQLPELPHDNVLAEPVARNTAPSVAWAAYRISHICPEARIIILPSDQAVFGDELFLRDVRECFDFVAQSDCLIAMGVRPTRDEPGYGYIQMGDPTRVTNLFSVKSFTEKPERAFARMFVDSGEFLWNTGIFMSNVGYLVKSLRSMLPAVLRIIDGEGVSISLDEERRYVEENFSKFPNLSIDNGILELSDNVYVMRCSFGWADMGTWHSVYESMSHAAGDNVTVDSVVVAEDCRNNIFKLPKGKIAVVNGLDGYIVADTENVLLICKKSDSSALVKKYVNEVGMRYGDDYV